MRIENSISTDSTTEKLKKLQVEKFKKNEELRQRVQKELAEALQSDGIVTSFLGCLDVASQTKSGLRLRATISSCGVSDAPSDALTEAPMTFSGYILTPTGWRKRLKISSHFNKVTTAEFITLWKSLLEESETVLAPKPESTIYETEEAQHHLSEMLKDFAVLTEVCPSTVKPEGIDAVATELEIVLSNDPTLSETPEGRSARLYSYLGGLTLRSFVFAYKDHYFILCDAGGSCWEYVSTVQEFILSLTGDTRFEL